MAATFATLVRLANPLSFDQHILWISVPLLPLLAQPSKSCPVILLTAVQGFDKLKVDASPRFFGHHLELPQEFKTKEGEPLESVEIGQDILKGLIEREQGLVGVEFLRRVFHEGTPAFRI